MMKLKKYIKFVMPAYMNLQPALVLIPAFAGMTVLLLSNPSLNAQNVPAADETVDFYLTQFEQSGQGQSPMASSPSAPSVFSPVANQQIINAEVVENFVPPQYLETPREPAGPPVSFLSEGTATPEQGQKIMIDVLELVAMDIKDVLKLISRKSGYNVIAGGDIQGRVTIFLQNVEVHDVLRIILDANNLAYIEEGGVIRVMPAADYERLYGRKFGAVTEKKIVKLQGINPTDAVNLLNQIKSSIGRIVADESSSTVLIEDTSSKLREMEDYIAQIDAPALTQVIELHYIQAEGLSTKLQEMLTPKLGTVKFDTRSNKLFVKDTEEKLKKLVKYIEAVDVPQATEVFDISYAKAEDLTKSVQGMLTEGSGRVEFDARSNQLIITDTAMKIREVEKVIKSLDVKEKEVLIEAKIVQVDLNDSFTMGIDWAAMLPEHHDLRMRSNFSGIAGTANQGTLTLGALDDRDYGIVVDALEAAGKTKILSSPRIAVINNQEAKILVGTTKPYVTTTTTTPATGPTTTAEAVNFIDVGVKLYVTPTVHNDDFITMKIKPEVSTAAESITTSEDNEIPIKETSEVETTIRVKDGATVIIGGLIKDERSDTRSGLPFLSRIPVLGVPFRSEDRNKEKTEIVIFLTPHLITGDVQTPIPPESFTLSSENP